MLRRLVDALLTLKLLHRCRLPLGDLAPRRTGAVQTTHRAVIAAHGSIHTLLLVGNAGSKLSLVGRMPAADTLAAPRHHRRQGIGGRVIEQAPRSARLMPGRANMGLAATPATASSFSARKSSDINHV